MKKEKNKIVHFRAINNTKANKFLSDLKAVEYSEGDKARIFLPNGIRLTYVLQKVWVEKDFNHVVISNHVLIPGNNERKNQN